MNFLVKVNEQKYMNKKINAYIKIKLSYKMNKFF